jgi:ribose/xylose/arabinose/galactoside ABC-type transport system permease subunit
MRPNATQQRIVILMTVVLTFFGGFLLARGNQPGFMATLALLVLGWLLVAVLRPGDKPER